MNKIKLTAAQCAEIALYAAEWRQDNPVGRDYKEYDLGCRETAGHLLACLICQNLLPDECVETTTGMHLLEDCPNVKTLTKRIQKYVKGELPAFCGILPDDQSRL